ncbi:hypothetical protein BT96DRAFT_936159 [Gymnopus androsaceus JB14]|uniref:Uncharacterized protein n=1 Tax=Gymnopus androsaceus JB14 TaxID=1447944 RepID=A0A6A4I2S0_9AGAR|nr:hypothetical protein BT96DRAFT_936159 [Gymnopus androsaceus JB14]
MPMSIEAWSDACYTFSHDFDQQQGPRPNVSCNYVLPEPALFANHSQDDSRQAYFAMYLKLRLVIMYRIRSKGMLECLRSAGDWRKILGLELHGTKKDSQAGKIRGKFIADMQAELDNANINLDLADLHKVVPSWCGIQYPEEIPDSVCKEILQEIFTISFKLELAMADQYLYQLQPDGFDSVELEEGEQPMFDELDALTYEEWKVKVSVFLPGFTAEGNTGFSSRDQATRRAAMYKLYRVMCGWRGGMPGIHENTHRLAAKLVDKAVSCKDMDTAKYHIAFHYVATFADFFKHAPVLPHLL